MKTISPCLVRTSFTSSLILLLGSFLLAIGYCAPAPAQDFEITARVTITAVPAGPPTNIVINIGTADTRTWTNDATLAPSTTIQITNSTATSATNLANHLGNYPVYSAGAGTPRLGVSVSNTVAILVAPVNTNITVTFGGTWATVVYVTNFFGPAPPILSSTNRMSAPARTNAENAIVNLLAVNRSTNAVPTNTTALRNYIDLSTPQSQSNKTIVKGELLYGRATGITNLTGTNFNLTTGTLAVVTITTVTITGGNYAGFINSLTNGTLYSNVLHYAQISNAIAIGGNVYRFTNGYWTNAILGSPLTTNLVNYGNAISSTGDGANSEQFGLGAYARNDGDTALGNSALATNGNSTAVGNQATAFAGGSAFGQGALANTNTATFGFNARGAGNNNAIFGAGSDDNGFANVTIIGPSIAATADNQVLLGSASQLYRVFGPLLMESGATNSVLRGTNVLNGRLDFTARANSSLANGYNSGVLVGSNAYVRFSGPSGAYTNVGFAAPGGPQFVVCQFDNPGLSFTLLHESGLDATAANRILTGTGAPLNSTNNPVMLGMQYDDSASRWRVLYLR